MVDPIIVGDKYPIRLLAQSSVVWKKVNDEDGSDYKHKAGKTFRSHGLLLLGNDGGP
jgi:hypothetical protein